MFADRADRGSAPHLAIVGTRDPRLPTLLSDLQRAGPALAGLRLFEPSTPGAIDEGLRAAAGALPLEVATDLPGALRDATVVLHLADAGTLASRRLDTRLPLELGLPAHTAFGPAGLLRACRAIPQALELAEAVATHAPRAVFLQGADPIGLVTQSLHDAGRRAFGLAPEPFASRALFESLAAGAVTLRGGLLGVGGVAWIEGLDCMGAPWEAPAGTLEMPAELDGEQRLRLQHAARIGRAMPEEGWPTSQLAVYAYPKEFVELARERADAVGSTRDRPQAPAPLSEATRAALGSLGGGGLAPLHRPNDGLSEAFEPDTVVLALGSLGDGPADRPATSPKALGELLRRLERYQRLAAHAIARRGDLTAALVANPLVANEELAARLLERARTRYPDPAPALRAAA